MTADCPLLDPGGGGTRGLRSRGPGWCNSTTPRTSSSARTRRARRRGADGDALERAFRLGRSPEAREHVTWFLLRERPDLFRIGSVTDDADNSDLRWTVDHARDLELVRRLYDELDLARKPRSYREVVAYVREHPELATLNT